MGCVFCTLKYILSIHYGELIIHTSVANWKRRNICWNLEQNLWTQTVICVRTLGFMWCMFYKLSIVLDLLHLQNWRFVRDFNEFGLVLAVVFDLQWWGVRLLSGWIEFTECLNNVRQKFLWILILRKYEERFD